MYGPKNLAVVLREVAISGGSTVIKKKPGKIEVANIVLVQYGSSVPLMCHDQSNLGSLSLIQITLKERTQSVIMIDFRNSKQKDN